MARNHSTCPLCRDKWLPGLLCKRHSTRYPGIAKAQRKIERMTIKWGKEICECGCGHVRSEECREVCAFPCGRGA